jgi:2-polyprenyl-3-methyl-5-hydroxy-6-metoxy-1,4-benzoquinol methylase
MDSEKQCRFCASPLNHSFCDLGKTPLSNGYLKKEQLGVQEPSFALHAYVCEKCFLVQLEEMETPDKIFSDYAYFSSYSESWLDHVKKYTGAMVERFAFSAKDQVVEIASNDGYLLQFFKERNIPILGIEPAKNVAEVAIQKGIPTRIQFFGEKTAMDLVQEGVSADLLIGNNVFAHVPHLNDFVKGMKILLAPEGIITLEFPHLYQLMRQNQFDTIYHEHFSYFSLLTVEKVFQFHGLELFDVEELTTHGGSLRVFVKHQNSHRKIETAQLEELRKKEKEFGLDQLSTYLNYAQQVEKVKVSLLDFLRKVQLAGKTIAAYGAPAKGNTLLNFCNVTSDLLPFTVDLSPHKQGHYLPGSRIPIYSPAKIEETKPDYVLILPWNIKTEVMAQMKGIRSWGGQFVVPIPELQVIS